MKLNKREKILVIISGALLIGFVIYNFILSPQFVKLNDLQVKAAELDKNVYDSRTSIDSIKLLDEKINDKTNEILGSTKELFPSLQQNEIIILLDNFIKKSNITIQGINFSEIGLSPIENKEIDANKQEDSKFKNIINQYKDLIKDNKKLVEENSEKNTEEEEIAIENISVTIMYTGSYYELTNLLSYIESYDKSIIVRGLTVIQDEAGVSGNIVLDFYGIPKIDELEDEFIEQPNNQINGKDNPFQKQ